MNETTLSLWHKQKTRIEEVKTLLDGTTLPGAIATTTATPAPKQHFDIAHNAPLEPFVEPEDRIGKAKQRGPPKVQTTKREPQEQTVSSYMQQALLPLEDLPTASKHQKRATQKDEQRYKTIKPKPQEPAVYIKPPPPPQVVMLPYDQLPAYQSFQQSLQQLLMQQQSLQQPLLQQPPPNAPVAVPKSTFYRHKIAGKSASAVKNRKKYSCRKCGQPMEHPHGQYFGKRYCPNEPGVLPYDEWKKVQRQEMLKKRDDAA